MTVLRNGVARLVEQTEREISALFRRYSRGALSRSQFVALAAAVITRARARGVALADVTLTTEVVRALGARTAPLGLLPPDNDADHFATSVTSVLATKVVTATTDQEREASTVSRLRRLARDAPAEAAVWGMRLAMIERDVPGWIRETDADPCPVCVGLADGVVRSPLVVMKRHTGCACVQAAAFS